MRFPSVVWLYDYGPLLFVQNTICHQLIDTYITNTAAAAASPRRLRIVCRQARLYGRERKNPLSAISMVVLALLLFMLPSRRSLFGVNAQVSAKRIRRRGEMAVSVSVFLVCVLASC